ncbi:AAA family ATPase [Sorangium sp. So ce204]|uniref:AAA family ATPase n=1 Tax=Sorangium sp. So ce204 TaxID=3133288 RepID=UPI003F5FE03C
MLVQFLVENFRSFKGETVFSMRAPPGSTRAVASIPGHDGLLLMRAAAFYGANASGKSNLVRALDVACDLVARGAVPNKRLPASPFRLESDARQKPTRFQFDFIVEGVLYSYVLVITHESVAGEALYRTLPGTTNEELVYEREAAPDGGEHRVDFGPLLLLGDDEQKQFARFVAKGTAVQQPLLTELASRNVPGFSPIRNWFQEGLTVLGPSSSYVNLVKELFEDATLREFYGRMLRDMGTGVQSVEVLEEQDPKLSEFFRDYDEVVSMPKAKQLIQSILSGSVVEDPGVHIKKDGDGASVLKLTLRHGASGGTTVEFPLHEESDGTRRLLHLLPVLFHRTRESCTVIDELDRSLHTSLTRRFVEEFMAMTSGALSQLIFTTHDTNLLNGHLLPPGSIWFVEKDDAGASHLHSLADYRTAQLEHLLEHLEDGYLQGRFGAIPFLAHRDNLSWRPEECTE